MNYQFEMSDIAAENGGIITNKAAENRGISRATLYNLNRKGTIQRIAQGQYIVADDLQDELFSITVRSSNLILSHETALWLHGLSDRIPFVHSVTAPSVKMPSKSIRDNCKVYYIKPELFELGKTMLQTPSGNDVTVYDLERTICDCVRSRNKMGSETFLNALKEYAGRKDKNLNLLYTYADKLRVAAVVRKYLEVLL